MKQQNMLTRFFTSIDWRKRVLQALLTYVVFIHLMWAFTGHFESRAGFFIGWIGATLMFDYFNFRKHLNKMENK